MPKLEITQNRNEIDPEPFAGLTREDLLQLVILMQNKYVDVVKENNAMWKAIMEELKENDGLLKLRILTRMLTGWK